MRLRVAILLLVLVAFCSAKDIKPKYIIQTKALVTDFVLDGNELYIANDMGSVEVFDLLALKMTKEIKLEPFLDVKQQWQYPKILSVDRYKGKTLLVSSTRSGYREVWLDDEKGLQKIISTDKKFTAKEARFLDEKNILFATVAHEMVLYNSDDSYSSYNVQLQQSAFGDMALSEDKKSFITSSESGRVTLCEVESGKVIKKLESLNVDNIYKVDYKNGTIITAGQDRRVGVYPEDGEPYYIQSDFLVYSVALSSDAKFGIYSSTEEHHLELFDVKTKERLHRLIGHNSIITNIKFITPQDIFSSGDEDKLYFWKIE